MRLLTAYDVFSGCSWYRNVIPAHAAAGAGHDVRLAAGEVLRADLRWCEVLHVQRLWHPSACHMVKDARAQGKLTVYDVDDDMWAIGKHNPSYDHWHAHAGDALAVMRECDRVTTTNPTLAGTLRRWHKDVRIIPNALPDDFCRTGPIEHEGPLVVGWAGGNSHSADLDMIAPVLLEVLAERPGIIVALAGCGEGIRHQRLLHLRPVIIEQYHMLLSAFDIGLAPLVDDRFNRAKSDLKPLEYAAVGVPCVASRIGPYRDLSHGVLTAPSRKEFKRHLLALIDDEHLRRSLAVAGREWAETRRISRLLPMWVDAWTR